MTEEVKRPVPLIRQKSEDLDISEQDRRMLNSYDKALEKRLKEQVRQQSIEEAVKYLMDNQVDLDTLKCALTMYAEASDKEAEKIQEKVLGK